MTIIEQAYAKINLGLQVLDKRPDGFHNIRSLFQTVGYADTLELSLYEEPGLVVNDPLIPTGSENLVLKAESVLRDDYPSLPRVRFTLKKKIPAGAGLGGGSADAAAALRGLSAIHRLDLDNDQLRVYAARIGSDVPFLITGGTAVVTGRGEVLKPAEWPFRLTYVLVFPGFSISTAWAYRNLDPDRTHTLEFETVLAELGTSDIGHDRFFASLANDFETPVFREYPELAAIKDLFLSNGAGASVLSGSGSAMIGLFESESAAYHCANTIQIKMPKTYKVFTVQDMTALNGT